jgi:hypothetical protein
VVIIAILGVGLHRSDAFAVALVWRAVTIAGDLIVAGLAMANRRGRAGRADGTIKTPLPSDSPSQPPAATENAGLPRG